MRRFPVIDLMTSSLRCDFLIFRTKTKIMQELERNND